MEPTTELGSKALQRRVTELEMIIRGMQATLDRHEQTLADLTRRTSERGIVLEFPGRE